MAASRLRAIVLLRCPRCLEGRVFAGLIRMRDRCTLCGHRFEREHGYFQGAMYVSYGLAIGVFGAMAVGVELAAPALSAAWVLAVSLPPFLVLVPVLFRYSRVIWMHLNYRAF